ncbi:MAG: hypothetical protein WDA21_02870 [Bacilli bacterium]
MYEEFKAFDLLNSMLKSNTSFRVTFEEAKKRGLARRFNNNEWNLIKSQKRVCVTNDKNRVLGFDTNKFLPLFMKGYNIKEFVDIARQLSYSYDNISIIQDGRMTFQKSKLSDKDYHYDWLETQDKIIDPRLCIVVDKSLKEIFGYFNNPLKVLTAEKLKLDPIYQDRKKTVRTGEIEFGLKGNHFK